MTTEAAVTPVATADAIVDGIEGSGLPQRAKDAVYLAIALSCDAMEAGKKLVFRILLLSPEERRNACRALAAAVRQAALASEVELESAIARGEL